jgi:hypothetical protein
MLAPLALMTKVDWNSSPPGGAAAVPPGPDMEAQICASPPSTKISLPVM